MAYARRAAPLRAARSATTAKPLRPVRAVPCAAQWDVGRFLSQTAFFQAPPLEALRRMLGGPEPQATAPAASSSSTAVGAMGVGAQDVRTVLVTGATGGVGKRVVERLLAKGVRVRALVRDVTKAKELLVDALAAQEGEGALVLAAGDITQPRTLLPETFADLDAIVSCTAVKVQPKEGDDEQRSKYKQGIKFFDPEIVGDTPETVELDGLRNVLVAVRDAPGGGPGEERAVLSGEGAAADQPVPRWGALDDVIMGGVSESAMLRVAGAGEGASEAYVFAGITRTENNGGFASVRTANYNERPLDLSAYDGIVLRVRGDGQRYKFILRCDADWDGISFCHSFSTTAGEWTTVRAPFSEFRATRRAQTVRDAKVQPANITAFQLMLSKFEYDGELNPSFRAGEFSLPVASIAAYRKVQGPSSGAKVVHVGSAGVSRPFRPDEFDFAAEPPAVGLNDQLGGILTYKWLGEQVVRESGLPYAIIRPCALVEEPAGAELEWGQGDTLKGKVSRDAIADICVAALDDPAAAGKTFEVKCTQPFSEVYEQPEGFTPQTDFAADFGALQLDIAREGKDLSVGVPAEVSVAA